MKFKNLVTGLKLLAVNVLAGLVALVVNIITLAIFTQINSAWLLSIVLVVYIVAVISIGGWFARTIFGWK